MIGLGCIYQKLLRVIWYWNFWQFLKIMQSFIFLFFDNVLTSWNKITNSLTAQCSVYMNIFILRTVIILQYSRWVFGYSWRELTWFAVCSRFTKYIHTQNKKSGPAFSDATAHCFLLPSKQFVSPKDTTLSKSGMTSCFEAVLFFHTNGRA